MNQHLDRLDQLAPMLRVPARTFIDRAQAQLKVILLVVHTWRSVAQQLNIYQQGRTYNRETGEWEVSDPQMIKTKAKPGQSPHNLVMPDGTPASLALDVIPLDAQGAPIWDTDDDLWDDLYEIAWKCGLDPLGDPIGSYYAADKGHFEEPAYKMKFEGLGLVMPSVDVVHVTV